MPKNNKKACERRRNLTRDMALLDIVYCFVLFEMDQCLYRRYARLL
jgi:hypothetical protein